jgi:hypothetical protein
VQDNTAGDKADPSDDACNDLRRTLVEDGGDASG